MPSLYVIGDSISIQYGPHLEELLAGDWRYDRKRGAEDIEADTPDFLHGANGGDSDRVREYLAYRAEQGGFAPDVLLANCGLHDIKLPFDDEQRQVPIDRYRRNLEAIVDLVPDGTRLGWVRTTPVDEAVHAAKKDFRRLAADVDAYNAVADEVMAAHNVPTIDLFGFSCRFPPEALESDGVHFGEAWRPLQAAYLVGQLAARFGEP